MVVLIYMCFGRDCQLILTAIFFFVENQLDSFPASLILKCDQVDNSKTKVCYCYDLGP